MQFTEEGLFRHRGGSLSTRNLISPFISSTLSLSLFPSCLECTTWWILIGIQWSPGIEKRTRRGRDEILASFFLISTSIREDMLQSGLSRINWKRRQNSWSFWSIWRQNKLFFKQRKLSQKNWIQIKKNYCSWKLSLRSIVKPEEKTLFWDK